MRLSLEARVPDLGAPPAQHVIRGRLQLLAGDGAEGARIAVDGRRVTHLPAVFELSAAQSHEVTATRPGFDEFSTDVVFDGDAERSVNVKLERSGDAVASPLAADALPQVRRERASASLAPRTRARHVTSRR